MCSVDSAEYPLPEPKITLQSIAQRWLNKLSNKEGFNGGVTMDPPVNCQTDEVSAVPPQQSIEIVQEVQHKEADTSDPNNSSRESCRSEGAEVVLHSTPASGSTVSPLSSQEANSTFTKPTTNSTFTKADESCTDMDTHTQNITQLQIPSTKNTVNEVRENTSAHLSTYCVYSL